MLRRDAYESFKIMWPCGQRVIQGSHLDGLWPRTKGEQYPSSSAHFRANSFTFTSGGKLSVNNRMFTSGPRHLDPGLSLSKLNGNTRCRANHAEFRSVASFHETRIPLEDIEAHRQSGAYA
jgi:hypothetical protein